MRILFIGCVQSSYIELELLIKNNKNIVGVITKEKSSFNSDFEDLAPLAFQNGIPYKYVKNINDEDSIEFVKECNPDIAYCFGWSQLIKKEILSIPQYGVIGTHPTMLPYNRGRHPIIWALALGLTETASSFFVMDENADTGKVISQEIIQIKYEDYAEDLYNRIEESECRQILDFTEKYENGTISYIENDDEGNVWRKRGVKDGMIDWRMSSRAIYNLVRALSKPYPGAQFMYEDETVTVWKVEEVITDEYINIEPGKVVKYNGSEDFYVKAYDNLIHVCSCTNNKIKEGIYL